jgi:hypothetical protein
MGNLHLPLTDIRRWKARADASYTGPGSKEVIQYGEEKRREETEERKAQLITFLQS